MPSILLSPSSGLPSFKRIFDLTMAGFLLCFLSVPILVVGLMVKLTSKGPVLYWSDRVGINNTIFRMPKFRTMRINTPAIATHLMKNPDAYLTPIGFFLRKFSLDELPQLYSILKGDISFVGPRPALYNQDDLVELRTGKGIHKLIPGITGWAQVNGRDELPIPVKVEFDEYYLKNRSFLFDLKILWMTFFNVLSSKGIVH
ncbi:MAG: sugar transferase [Desulfobacteraceae bacterium]|uniref:Sugar transferase n=1 Tax=Candidatus Desulfaltia bathyphila TaxID=2841697 RepID=A0A8J6T8D6_9BACT|nr:sugar transferase [Candidatus Desulfaltia bathyphila]MBL7196335.1 sugar transferase [Desulfobacterales bacterium]